MMAIQNPEPSQTDWDIANYYLKRKLLVSNNERRAWMADSLIEKWREANQFNYACSLEGWLNSLFNLGTI